MTTKSTIYNLILTIIILLIASDTDAQLKQVYEAELAQLSGTATIVDCKSASGGQMVKGLDGDEINSVLFLVNDLPEAGEYFVLIKYFATSNRNLNYKLNDNQKVHTVPASGLWCYQGGVPATYIFKETFVAGENRLLFYQSPIIDNIVVTTDTTKRNPSVFYISSSMGDDNNNGTTVNSPFKTLNKVNSMDIIPGDSLLFKKGETFKGELVILNEGGKKDLPVFIGSYGNGKQPILDGNGYLSTIHIVNSSYLHFSDIEIKNDGGEPQTGEPDNIRYGIYFENSRNDGTFYEHYRLTKLTFKNIFPTIPVTDDDKTGVNGHAIATSGSWGDEVRPTRFDDMVIQDCYFTRTARHATVFGAVNNLEIRNNLFEHTGGAGMVIGNNCSNILVEGNVTNYTGSKIDERMAGRGSGIWCFQSRNLTVQHNSFKHAHGIHDSYGMHIDIGNRNVVYQYNLSEDNEGGFVEILGKNVNVGYRYNLSIGDGWRKRGNRHGQIFWLAGWSGDPQNPIGSDSIFIYNNSIYVRDTIAPGIWIEEVSKKARIYNNIIYVANQFGPVVIRNNRSLNNFDYNIWRGEIARLDEDGEPYQGQNAKFYNPLFTDEIIADPSGFVLQDESPAIGTGKLIYNPFHNGEFDYFYTHGGEDYYGNPVSFTETPNIGAINNSPVTSSEIQQFNSDIKFQIYPNPARTGQLIIIQPPSKYIGQEITVQINDLSGKRLFRKTYPRNQNISIKSDILKEGTYIMRCQSDVFFSTRKLSIL